MMMPIVHSTAILATNPIMSRTIPKTITTCYPLSATGNQPVLDASRFRTVLSVPGHFPEQTRISALAGKYFRASFLTLAPTASVTDDALMTQEIDDIQVVNVDEVEPEEVVPGIVRRQMPATQWARGWMYDFAPGAEWPEVDVHDTEERYYVVSGEFIDRCRRLGPGSYVVFAPGSTHRPRTETGARMLGISLSRR